LATGYNNALEEQSVFVKKTAASKEAVKAARSIIASEGEFGSDCNMPFSYLTDLALTIVVMFTSYLPSLILKHHVI
jgi:hypothetical protein